MAKVVYKVKELKDLEKVSSKIVSLSSKHNIFLFTGKMGSGKTTLIKEITKKIGVNDACSPTYSIINNYLASNQLEVFHIDCYRIEDENEAENIGLIEILNEDNLCFVEWPEKIHNLLPNKCVKINIELENNFRKIIINI
jgi:tRNA threonylcarbamoyladenosine biosynthesis protein TsaE